MHPVYTATELLKKVDPPAEGHPNGMGKVEGLKAFVEKKLEKLKLTYQNLQDLLEQPGQLYLENDIFHMENFVLEMNTNYLPRGDALQLNPVEAAVKVSVSLTADIKDNKDKVIFVANQFYDLRVITESSFKLLAPNGSQVSALKDIPKNQAVHMGLSIVSVKRSSNISHASVKTGKVQEFPSIVIPWMPGKMDQFAQRQQRGCGTFGPGSIVVIKLDASRKRLWLCNGVSGSGHLQGIPSEDDIFSKMFTVDFPVLRPFVAFSSKFQNVLLMPELPPVIMDVHKKTLSLEARLNELTAEFSELGGSDSLILFGFSSKFLEINPGDDNSEAKIDVVEAKLRRHFEVYRGISDRYNYLNFKIFSLYIKGSDSTEKVVHFCICIPDS